MIQSSTHPEDNSNRDSAASQGNLATMSAASARCTTDESETAPNSVPPTRMRRAAPADAFRFALARHGHSGWVLVVVLILLEWGLFRQFVLREIAWGFPRFYDQALYLGQSYTAFARIMNDGLGAGLLKLLAAQQPNGILLQALASFAYLFLGASRLSALTLNFAYFAALQCALVGTIRWLTGRWSLALISMGLLMMARSPFNIAGGLADFRIDFAVMCLFGMLVCAVVRSRLFLSLPWSLLVGIIGALVVLTRYITILYIATIFGVLLLFFGLQWRRSRAPAARSALATRMMRLAAAAGVFVLLITPVLWNTRAAFIRYYVAQATARAALRSAELGITSRSEALMFYPRSLAGQHLGTALLTFSAISLAIFGAYALASWRRLRALARPPDWGSYLLFVLLTLVVPLAAFTSNAAKSPIVGGVLVTPIIWVYVLLAWLTIGELGAARYGRLSLDFSYTGLACLAILIGLGTNLAQFGRATQFSQQRGDTASVISMYTDIGEYSASVGWKRLQVSTNANLEYLFPTLLQPVVYEQRGIPLAVTPVMGQQLFAIDAAQARKGLEQSDFVLMTDFAPGEQHVYPFNQSMQRLRPDMLAYCESHLLPIGRYRFFGRQVTVYVRPALVLARRGDGWITESGLTITGPAQLLAGQNQLFLSGSIPSDLLPKTPSVSAELAISGARQALPARLTSTSGRYQIELDLHGAELPDAGLVRIELHFDTYFVPRQAGLSNDTRQLVMRFPTSVTASGGANLPWEVTQ